MSRGYLHDSVWVVFRPIVAAVTCLIGLALPARSSPDALTPACLPGFNDCLTGSCCSGTSLCLPTLPAISFTDAKWVCDTNCTPGANPIGQLNISAPVQQATSCSHFLATVSGGLFSNPTQVHLYYTRHWTKTFPSVGQVEVFRFIAIGELAPIYALCTIEFPPFFVYGFVDYAFSCPGQTQQQFKGANVVLGHTCGTLMHDPACPFSANPFPSGGPHPGHITVIVAPGTNFTPSTTLIPPAGPAVAPMALRNLDQGFCTTNEPFAAIGLINGPNVCPCLPGPGQFTEQQIPATMTLCGSTVFSVPSCPYNIQPESLMTWSVGVWMPPGFPGLPGGNKILLTEGDLRYIPGCVAGNQPVEQYYGAETTWSGGQAGRRFDAVTNQNPLNPASPYSGAVGTATRVLFFN